MKHLFRILSVALMASAMVACTEETEPEQQSPATLRNTSKAKNLSYERNVL